MRIVPEPPTTHPWEAEVGKAAVPRPLAVPDVWLDQVEPPFVVFRIVPPVPVAQQVLVLIHAIPFMPLAVPDVWLDQVEPPFVVLRIVPPVPSTQQWLESGQLMAFRPLVVPEF